ncbi:hypothetical protein QZN11_40535 [Streptomyces gramineus]
MTTPDTHEPHRARTVFSSPPSRWRALTSEADTHALDRVLFVDSDVGQALPDDTTGPRLRPYADDAEAVRILYFATAVRTVVVVAYIEV